jgi:hypothetical protein
MAVLQTLNPILHRIRVKLYPNYLKHGEGAYIARTDNEKTLSVEDVCIALKTRGGFSGSFEDLLDYIRQYDEEVAYQLCDGYAVNNGYYTIHPNIGGTFNSTAEIHDHQKHPITFRFSARSKLRNLIKNIEVVVEGMADTGGYIDEYIDQEGDYVNSQFMPDNMFAIHGHKIKIAGDDPSCGLYFVPVQDPSRAVKVTRVGDNNPTKVTGIAPNTGHTKNRIEIRTQYSGSGAILLKTPRTITSSFTLEQVQAV